MRILPAALAALLAGAAALPASAQTRVAAGGANLRYTLTDLAPSDGLDPSVTFTKPVNGYLIGTLDVQAIGQPRQNWSEDRPIDAPGALTHDLPFVHAGTGYLGKEVVAGAVVLPVADTAVYVFERTGALQEFRLAPHTSITYSLDAVLDLALDKNNRAVQGGSGSVILALADFDRFATYEELYRTVSNDSIFGLDPAVQLSRTLSLTWTNDSDGWRDGYVSFDAYVVARIQDGTVSPIPEPSAWAMLGLGCALLGIRGRRRRATRSGNETAPTP